MLQAKESKAGPPIARLNSYGQKLDKQIIPKHFLKMNLAFYLVILALFSGAQCRCSLRSYRAGYIKGNNGHTIRYEPGFGNSLNTLNGYARSCGVTVYVTSSFRRYGQSISGAVVTPSSRSNHFVGHAIDFNLNTPRGWCNSTCLRRRRNRNAECFIRKVINNNNLRWGGLFSNIDPVHIDDGLNLRNSFRWSSLYNALQRNCQ